MGDKFCAKDFLIQLSDDGGSTYTDVGGVASNNLTINNETVDVTTKGSSRWRQLHECGVRTMTLSGEGFIEDDDMQQLLREMCMGNPSSIGFFRVISGIGDVYEGQFQISTAERGGANNEAESFSFTLESAGAVAYTPPV